MFKTHRFRLRHELNESLQMKFRNKKEKTHAKTSGECWKRPGINSICLPTGMQPEHYLQVNRRFTDCCLAFTCSASFLCIIIIYYYVGPQHTMYPCTRNVFLSDTNIRKSTNCIFICLIASLTQHKSSTTHSVNPSAWGHLNPSSYCDVGRLFYGVFKLWSKLQRKK